jgi:hypothetical protein
MQIIFGLEALAGHVGDPEKPAEASKPEHTPSEIIFDAL